jgi:hypothetical protein
MGLYFPSGGYMYFDPMPAAVAAADARTWSGWVKVDTAAGDQVVAFGYDENTDENCWTLKIQGANKVEFKFVRTITTGRWTAGALVDGSLYHIAVTYDRSDIGNDPIIYIDGISAAVTEIGAPSGSLYDESDDTLYLSGDDALITIHDLRIYNRILTPAEILEIYTARGCDNILSGEVFAPLMTGAAGLQAFDGVTLATANTITDPYSGATGVPAGSPVGRGETYLSVCHH